MDRLTAVARLVVFAGLAVTALAGCRPGEMIAVEGSVGVANMEPEDAVDAALEAIKAAGPLVYSGRVKEFFAGASRPLDTELTLDGRDCVVEATSDEFGSMEVRLVDEHFYIRASARAFEELVGLSAKEAATIGDRWIGSPRPDFIVCDPVEIAIGELDHDSCTAGGDEVLDGTPTVFVRCRANAFEQRIYMATEGAPLVVRVETVDMTGSHLTLVDRDPDARIEAPPEAEVIDMTDVA